jgi:hypothetical protein
MKRRGRNLIALLVIVMAVSLLYAYASGQAREHPCSRLGRWFRTYLPSGPINRMCVRESALHAKIQVYL